jgi:hypothetical protein
MNKDVTDWACSGQMINNTVIEKFNNKSGGEKPLWRNMCKYEDKVNMDLKGKRCHCKECYNVTHTSFQWLSFVDIIINVGINKSEDIL